MLLTHLSLTHFRNYRQLELDFTGPLVLLQGRNAQGKTNLLEAIFMLATSKPVHALNEREIVDWLAGEVISGFSEDDQQRRLAIELRATAECQELVDGLCSMLAGLRSGSFPEAGRWKSILSHVLVLARYVEQEVVSEMWLSQPGETPVYVTSDTFGHASQLIRELSV